MRIPRHSFAPRRRKHAEGQAWIVPAALFLPLVLLIVVTGMTWRSERRAVVATDRVIHDYAAIAVWQYVRRASMALHEEVMRAFPASGGTGDNAVAGAEALDPAKLIERRGSDSSALLRRARFVFRYDRASGRIETAGEPVGAATLGMLKTRLDDSPAGEASEDPHQVAFASADGRDYAIGLWYLRAPSHPRPLVMGVVSDASELAPVFAQVLRPPGLLPALSGAANASQDDLALRLTRGDGKLVFETPSAPGATAASDTIPLRGGALRATLDLSPALARALIGGRETSRLPSLALMLAVAAALAIIGLVQYSRNRALSRARDRFVANTSHELRTPLAQISMFAETLHLGRERNEAERRQFAGIVFSEARRLTALVENVLRFSRGELHAPALQPHDHDVATLISKAVEAFSPIAAASEVQVDASVKEGMVAALDESAFQQIMLNLLDNAVKHGSGARVTISAAELDDSIRVFVDDAGPGVPTEWRDRVFDAFTQIAGRNVAGAGIGLAVVRDLARAHGGDAWIESSPMGGARVVVEFPRSAGTARPADASTETAPARA